MKPTILKLNLAVLTGLAVLAAAPSHGQTAETPAPVSDEDIADRLLDELPLQAGSLDGAEGADAMDASAARTSFRRLFGIFLSPESITSEEEGTFKVSYGPLRRLNVAVSLAEPVLRDEVTEALDTEAEGEALDDLDLADDVSLEVRVQLLGQGREEDISKVLGRHLFADDEQMSEELQENLLHEDRLLLAKPEIVARQERLSELHTQREMALCRSPYDTPACTKDKATGAELKVLIETLGGELEELIAKPLSSPSAFGSYVSHLKKTKGKDLLQLYRAKLNRPQLHLTGRYRWADDLIAASGGSLGLTLQWGLPRLPDDPDQCDLDAIARKHPHSFAVEAAYTQKDRILVTGQPDLGRDAFEEAKVSFNWSTKVMQDLLTVGGTPVGGNQSLTATYLRPNGDFNHERWTVNETLTFFLTDTVSLPLSITYSNRQETIDEDELRGNIGFSFSLQRKKDK